MPRAMPETIVIPARARSPARRSAAATPYGVGGLVPTTPIQIDERSAAFPRAKTSPRPPHLLRLARRIIKTAAARDGPRDRPAQSGAFEFACRSAKDRV